MGSGPPVEKEAGDTCVPSSFPIHPDKFTASISFLLSPFAISYGSARGDRGRGRGGGVRRRRHVLLLEEEED